MERRVDVVVVVERRGLKVVKSERGRWQKRDAAVFKREVIGQVVLRRQLLAGWNNSDVYMYVCMHLPAPTIPAAVCRRHHRAERRE